MLMTISELADEYGLTRHAILVPIHKGRLKAERRVDRKTHFKWVIDKRDFEDYRKSRYNRAFSKVKGKFLYDKSKGFYSVNEAAEFVGCSSQRIYHHLRTGIIKCRRVKCNWVIHIDDIKAYKDKLVKRYPRKRHKKCLPFERLY